MAAIIVRRRPTPVNHDRQDRLSPLRRLSQPARHVSRPRIGSPAIASAEPGECWLYCYPDDAFTEY